MIMARPFKNRFVFCAPKMQGYAPFGSEGGSGENIIIQFDEFESLKLVNYDNLPQEEAAVKMNVSRPTLTRIYNSALVKVAKAFVEGKTILIGGGNVQFDKEWYRCKKCFRLIDGMENHSRCPGCSRFGDDELVRIDNQIDEIV
jgi:predicted DNA-binding protein (UPF0251 family)